ncbi:sterile alpha motif domain-containing protein 3-like [Apostichopus japonicus]|uniref:sterile alpha motif domain-containing protein 3-like n=1 Tax=Stichopus japonicus TaxID=307972 RepID=UPI003AB254B7
MKKEFKKNTPNVDLIKERMEITYAQRRKLINSKPLIIEVQENYPALFSPCEIGNEFKRLTDTELHKTFESSLSKAASKILSEVKLKPQLLPIVMKHLQIEDKTVAALLVLPVVFGNESFFKLYEEETSRDCVVDAAENADPFVAVIGDVMKPKCCYIVVEKHIVFDTANIISAASSLFGLLYACNIHYTTTTLETYTFIQKFCMKLSDKLKTPRRVRTFVEKIRE